MSVEEEALGTGGAIALAREHLTGKGPVLVLNGDLVSSVDVVALTQHHEKIRQKRHFHFGKLKILAVSEFVIWMILE